MVKMMKIMEKNENWWKMRDMMTHDGNDEKCGK